MDMLNNVVLAVKLIFIQTFCENMHFSIDEMGIQLVKCYLHRKCIFINIYSFLYNQGGTNR